MNLTSTENAAAKTSITYPLNTKLLLRNQKSIRRALSAQSGLIEKKIAILGGSTTAAIREMLEIFLLNRGIRPLFFESEYNKYFEDVVFGNKALTAFAPDLIYIHTTNVNIRKWPKHGLSDATPDILLDHEMESYHSLWDAINNQFACPIIQNNFDPPRHRPMGNLEAWDSYGNCLFINQLNLLFAKSARERNNLYIHDINWLAASIGLANWKNYNIWYSAKYAISFDAIPAFTNSLASIIGAIFGLSRKCLVLDLDNTLWGGVIGDDGQAGIQIGKETSDAEAHYDLQAYVQKLKDRGIILAVASKNSHETALEGLSHPENLLKAGDFSVIKANWDPKHENIRQIARELNIGVDSLLFIDDNVVERDIVQSNEPAVCVPDIGSDISDFITVLDSTGEFEPISISLEDRNRSKMYSANVERTQLAAKYHDYDDFLNSLEMIAHICSFGAAYMERVAQLTNKSNQFNLTTRRYTLSDIQDMSNDNRWITLQGRLKDRYGDNGIVSVVAGEINDDALRIDLWLMSCRVLKRKMEFAMLDSLIKLSVERGVKTLIGEYFPTAKNSMVCDFYRELGFERIEILDTGYSKWLLQIDHYKPIYNLMEIKNDY